MSPFTTPRSTGWAMGAAAALASLTAVALVSAPAAPSQALTNHQVSPDDPVMGCEGSDAPPGWCKIVKFDVVSRTVINLPAEQVTDYVAGCTDGNQPTVSKSITYSRSFSISASLGMSAGVNGGGTILREAYPAASVGAAWTTTFGSGSTYSIPADQGQVSWGVFSQQAVEVVANMTVRVEEPAADVPNAELYSADGVRLVFPLEDKNTGLPHGTLAKQKRPFSSDAERSQLCG